MFKVIMTFVNGDTHTEEHALEEALWSALQRLAFGPAARMGIIADIKVVDMLDCITFHCKWNGKEMKVTYPPRVLK